MYVISSKLRLFVFVYKLYLDISKIESVAVEVEVHEVPANDGNAHDLENETNRLQDLPRGDPRVGLHLGGLLLLRIVSIYHQMDNLLPEGLPAEVRRNLDANSQRNQKSEGNLVK